MCACLCVHVCLWLASNLSSRRCSPKFAFLPPAVNDCHPLLIDASRKRLQVLVLYLSAPRHIADPPQAVKVMGLHVTTASSSHISPIHPLGEFIASRQINP